MHKFDVWVLVCKETGNVVLNELNDMPLWFLTRDMARAEALEDETVKKATITFQVDFTSRG